MDKYNLGNCAQPIQNGNCPLSKLHITTVRYNERCIQFTYTYSKNTFTFFMFKFGNKNLRDDVLTSVSAAQPR